MTGAVLDGQVAVITGAGRGLGRAYALAYAREGARVVVNDVDATSAESVVEEIGALGGEAVASHDTVAEPSRARRIVATGVERFGRIDVMITNAGADRRRPVLDLEPDDWEFTLRTHLFGSIHCSIEAGRAMRDQGGGGAIVNVCSAAFYVGTPTLAPYGVAKGGIYGLMRSLSGELAPFGISVNAVAPPLTATAPALAFLDSLTDMGLPAEQVEAMRSSMPQPDDVAAITVFLATPEGRRLSGRLFTMTKDDLTAIDPPDGGRLVRAPGERWTLDDLGAAVQSLVGDVR
ncbi:MAG TPA: SDR family NAD(P)-dependent oxidoreductase [Jiangellaceae bacterium]|nr:SDR family NAD(P)-dependent oxidoreductase [Jiangellaceae bacterium]